MSSEHIAALTDLLLRIRERITDESNVLWIPYDSPAELRKELEEEIALLRQHDLAPLNRLKFHFMAASTFQELAVTNGWGDELLLLAAEFDRLYAALQPGRAPQFPGTK